ncbi:hypothetical protein [Arthrobacter glacialis]|uniref:hypothetical protein n=1 Tax=Arthrobacter glacialis TaxID=1664 RepID=UPI000CD453D9|nr:hypothetical protein [Arthrobacter glacialis]POH57488.1 hypothetical protein CVS28_15790 [Arthrobacter glacialis]
MGPGICRNDPAATNGVPKIFCTTSDDVALDIQSTHEAVIIMGPWTSEACEVPIDGAVDQSLARPPEPDIPIDQLMRAVEGVRPYVKIHLARFGFFQDVNDVLQDIRVAAWEGTVNGSYQAFPGVKFDAWVQGIACNLCADHIRRTFARSTLPLLDQGESGFQSQIDVQLTRLDDQVTNHVWATEVLQFVKAHVPERTWDLAVASLSDGKAQFTATNADVSAGMRWQSVFVVRQMALTASRVLDVDPHRVVDLASLRRATVASLSNPMLRLIAERIVLPAVLGKARAAAVAEVAQEVGVSVRYVKVQVGLVRSLVQAAEEILRAGTGIEGAVIKTAGSSAVHAVSKA